ncbi:MAG TPA: acyl-CoA desaturase [Candidatus Saccharimonadales bacterium]|nr:acyl-CoA desaturase [Candidatus Saccharimonadales bacterium]
MTSTARPQVKFQSGGEFWQEMRRRVQEYVDQPHCANPHCNKSIKDVAYTIIHRKAIKIVAWWAVSYAALLLFAHNWWQVALIGASLVLACYAAATCIMHDGNHGAFSRSPRVNRLAGFTMEMLGGSSFVWRIKHNQLHHTGPNIDGWDDDISNAPWVTLAPTQKHYAWTRYQHIYIWPLYGLMILRWQLWGDILTLKNSALSTGYKLRPPSKFDWTELIVGKILCYTWIFGLPIALHWSWHGFAMVMVTYAALSFVFSFMLTLTFQLAHMGEGSEAVSFDDVGPDGKFKLSFVEHTLMTTADFCPNNRALTWMLGGLNFQIEHHLFPKLPHVLYPDIARIVYATCVEYYGPGDEGSEDGVELPPGVALA